MEGGQRAPEGAWPLLLVASRPGPGRKEALSFPDLLVSRNRSSKSDLGVPKVAARAVLAAEHYRYSQSGGAGSQDGLSESASLASFPRLASETITRPKTESKRSPWKSAGPFVVTR